MKITTPLATTASIQQTERLFQGRVEAGIQRGLEDVAQGRCTEMTLTHLETLRARLQAQARSPKKAHNFR